MTSMMFRKCLAVAVVALAAVSKTEASGDASPFAGTWSGTWSIAERGLVGTFDLTISDAGRITGRVANTTIGKSGRVVGHIGADGTLDFVAFAPSDTPGDGPNGVPFKGIATIDGDGSLVISANGTDSDGPALSAILQKD